VERCGQTVRRSVAGNSWSSKWHQGKKPPDLSLGTSCSRERRASAACLASANDSIPNWTRCSSQSGQIRRTDGYGEIRQSGRGTRSTKSSGKAIRSSRLRTGRGRHTAVSEEDFEREPHRNRFTVLLGRTTHLAYHLGQATLGASKGIVSRFKYPDGFEKAWPNQSTSQYSVSSLQGIRNDSEGISEIKLGCRAETGKKRLEDALRGLEATSSARGLGPHGRVR